jgi:hypothetical protein
MANASSLLRVAWQRRGHTGLVDIYLQSAGGVLTPLLTNRSGDFADVTLPPPATSRAKIVIRAVGAPTVQDSTDAYFSIRTTTGSFVNPSGATAVLVGSIVNLEWVSPQGSQFVDVELFDPDTNQFRTTYGNVRDFVLNLPDRGRHAYLMPERWMANAFIRLTFKGANGATISTLNSPRFDIRYTLSTGGLTAFYRLYSPITLEHLFTTDANEYKVLSAPGGGWVGESNPPAPVDQILSGDYQIGGVRAVPFFRLYNIVSLQHLWTTGRNEYLTLRESTDWAPEHLVGYIFPSQVPGSTPFYRLAYPGLPLHHWRHVLDADELAGVRVRQRFDQHAIDHTEDRRVRANAQRQRRQSNHREAWLRAECPRRKPQILPHALHPRRAVLLTAPLPHRGHSAQPLLRRSHRLLRPHPFCRILLGQHLDVVSQFSREPLFLPFPPE